MTQERPITSERETRRNVINGSGWWRTLQKLRPSLPWLRWQCDCSGSCGSIWTVKIPRAEENQIKDFMLAVGWRPALGLCRQLPMGCYENPLGEGFKTQMRHTDGFVRAHSGLGHWSILDKLLYHCSRSSDDPFILMNLLHVKTKWKPSIQSVCD